MVFSAGQAPTCLVGLIIQTLHQPPAVDSPNTRSCKQKPPNNSTQQKVQEQDKLWLSGTEMLWISFPGYHHARWPEVAQANACCRDLPRDSGWQLQMGGKRYSWSPRATGWVCLAKGDSTQPVSSSPLNCPIACSHPTFLLKDKSVVATHSAENPGSYCQSS